MIHITQIIENKRDGLENSSEELSFLLDGFMKGEIKDYQMSAWLMAVCCRGLSHKELTHWTELMWKSGKSFPRSQRPDYWIDKHSTGGVGDKTSLILVPLVTAVCERVLGKGKVKLPMVSGRGLGHSGGTLDKLESVPAFSSSIDFSTAMDLLHRNGFFMMGQTKDLAPADRLIYSLRDVTGTVESIPLIVSSIMSKKLSENLDGIVLDVKTGEGAFMRSEKNARLLAKGLTAVAKAHKVQAVAVITRMDEPLGFKVGNLLEVQECAEFLNGTVQEEGLKEVVLALAGQMIRLGSGGKLTAKQAEKECEKELSSERPFTLYKEMFEAQGGRWSLYEASLGEMKNQVKTVVLRAAKKGFVSSIKAKEVGLLLNDLGGGRKTKEDKIDPYVGIELHKKVGDAVREKDAIMTVYYRKDTHRDLIEGQSKTLFSVGSARVKKKKQVLERV